MNTSKAITLLSALAVSGAMPLTAPGNAYEAFSTNSLPSTTNLTEPTQLAQVRIYFGSPRIYNPPTRIYHSPARIYYPPTRIYHPPARIDYPRARIYNPPPGIYYPGARIYDPPARIYYPPPLIYQPPSGIYIRF
jgi:hypothetical protein